jgi:predicted ATPase
MFSAGEHWAVTTCLNQVESETGALLITKLRLIRFKGFRDFTVHFGDAALLLGPNNAGKSTVISALRLGGAAAKAARRLKATDAFADATRSVRGHTLARATGSGFVTENVRHEFREETARLELTFKSKSVLHMVWPPDNAPFFWVEYPKGLQVVTPTQARQLLSSIGMVPTLTPVDHDERRLGEDHVLANVETRLASRHFRNQLATVRSHDQHEFDELIEYLLVNTPELNMLTLASTNRDNGNWLDLYYTDSGSPTEKEIYWAGDGLQIWLQVLFHLHRHRLAPTVVLDEPDVFLHPDLQRRLVRVLETTDQQIIMATHSPEVANEARHGSVVWIERTQRAAKRVTDDASLGSLTGILGTGFNLSIARALRSRVALFVEGDDMKLLRTLARQLGAARVADEQGLTVIPIGGFSRWPSVEAFAWLKNELLGGSVEVRLLLDRDYRSDAACRSLEQSLARGGVRSHVWRRKELESYLIEPAVLGRLTGLGKDRSREVLLQLAEVLKQNVMAQYVKAAIEAKPKHVDIATATQEALTEGEALWAKGDRRLHVVPAKDLLSAFNQRLQADGLKPLATRRIAAAITVEDADLELVRFMSDLDESLA